MNNEEYDAMRCDFIMEFSKYESKAMEEPEKVRKRERERPRNRQTRFVIIIYISDGFLCWIMTCYRTPLFIFIKFGGTLNNWNEKKNDEPAQMKAGDVFSLNFLSVCHTNNISRMEYQMLYAHNGPPNIFCYNVNTMEAMKKFGQYFMLSCEW